MRQSQSAGPTRMSHRLSPVGETALVAATTLLVTTGLTAPPLSAAAEEPCDREPSYACEYSPTILFNAGPRQSFFERAYGAADPIAIGSATTKIVIEAGVPSNRNGAACSVLVDDVNVSSGRWTQAEWATPGAVQLAVPAGAVGDDTRAVLVECFSGQYDRPGFALQWHLARQAGVSETVSLTDDRGRRSLNVVRNYLGDLSAEPRAIRLGSTLRLLGEPATWPVGSSCSGQLWASLGSFDNPVQGMDECRITSDGATIEIDIPSSLIDPALTRSTIEVTADRGGTVSWQQNLRITTDDIATSTSRIALSRSYGISRERIRVTAAVEAPGVVEFSGVVTFLVDGRAVGTAEVSDSDRGRARFELPRLPRGSHVVEAAFGSTTGIAPSRSEPKRLRILL